MALNQALLKVLAGRPDRPDRIIDHAAPGTSLPTYSYAAAPGESAVVVSVLRNAWPGTMDMARFVAEFIELDKEGLVACWGGRPTFSCEVFRRDGSLIQPARCCGHMAAAAAGAADPYINTKPRGCRVRLTTGGDSQECASSGGDIVRFGNSGALALSSNHKDSDLAEMEARSLAPLAGDTIALALKKTNGGVDFHLLPPGCIAWWWGDGSQRQYHQVVGMRGGASARAVITYGAAAPDEWAF
ncbi:hypothetical protein Rsub_03027 [Raphidocelis subcapitata]|uniref:Uncharacterized protein n=1 Tax=Raphidocelis subcapitata TaxID=307507 RepID=A0A2V0NSW6_9CHLO|nr:hypothetical protein Rsub_03027 [Raphidocelis subcapitata]|eukprot:GBF90726.1 hypothetical protein Rsub_03027 [Raphidocelis subcapitata]